MLEEKVDREDEVPAGAKGLEAIGAPKGLITVDELVAGSVDDVDEDEDEDDEVDDVLVFDEPSPGT